MLTSLVIPCFNEIDNLKLIFDKKIQNFKKGFEIIFVDNGSNDGSYQFLKAQLKKYNYIKVIKLKKNIGYGGGIKKGLSYAKGDLLSWTHADLQTDLLDVISARNIFKKDDDMMKIIKGIRVNKRNFFSSLISKLMAMISKYIFNFDLKDINAQPKLFSRSFYKKHMSNLYVPNDFSLDIYFLSVAKVNNCKVVEFPVRFLKRKKGIAKGGESSLLNKLLISITVIKTLFFIKLHRL